MMEYITPYQKMLMERKQRELSMSVSRLPVLLYLKKRMMLKCMLDIVIKNIYAGGLRRIAENIEYGVVLLTNADKKERNMPKEFIMNMGRVMERKLDETIEAVRILIKNGFNDDLMQKQYQAMRELRRDILPNIMGSTSTFSGVKEKEILNLGSLVSELRKCVYMAESGTPYVPSDTKKGGGE